MTNKRCLRTNQKVYVGVFTTKLIQFYWGDKKKLKVESSF